MSTTDADMTIFADQIPIWAQELGFQQIGITDVDSGEHAQHFKNWLKEGYQGEMDYLENHGEKRLRPDQLIEGTIRVISVRMDYLSMDTQPIKILNSPDKAYISRYSLGRDYHKLIRQRLAKLAKKIDEACQGYQYRAFVDSAPVLERAFAQKSGLGWFGKNTMIINRKAGSWFFLGEIYTTLPLPISEPYTVEHCGKCHACLDICPTQAFTGPYQLDGRKCISYLTIEYKGSIPVELREKMGNRIFGCDDCQLICPWNRFAKPTQEKDFSPRHHLEQADLLELFSWDETTFLKRTEGSAIRRAGYESWLRNIAIALGNAPYSDTIIQTFKQRLDNPSSIVKEHVQWAYQKQLNSKSNAT
jgi:epoxyqueuosine reductase